MPAIFPPSRRVAQSLLPLLLVACGTESTPAPGDDAGPGADVGTGDTACTGATCPSEDAAAPDDAAQGEDAAPADDTSGGADAPPADAGGPVTWHGGVRALVETHCASCHVEGGAAPFALSSYADARTWGGALVGSVVQRRMPPWMPDPDCHPILGERHLSDEQIAVFEAWATGGFAEGDAAEYIAPDDGGRVALPAPTLELRASEAYTPNARLPDDYRCLVLDHVFETDTYLTATDILPDQRAMVHHVLLYKVEADEVTRMRQLDADDAGPGYTCFGGPSAGNGTTIAGWVPGGQPMVYPEGSGILLEAGSMLVMQVHYNTIALEGALPADRTTAHLWTLAPGEVPRQVVTIFPFANTGIRIDAGDPDSVHTSRLTLPIGGRLIGTAPHMHTLGTRIGVRAMRGGEERCIVDIPAWDFQWQQFYRYPDDAFMDLRPGDVVEMTCAYDNSPGNQPVVNGEQLEPRDVRWGEGTFDEMCLNYLIVARPNYPDDGSLCSGFEPCVQDCGFESGQCYLDCATLQTRTDCLECTFDGLRPCITEYCGAQALPLLGCINGCSNNLDCIVTECMEELDVLYACIGPRMAAGDCDEGLAACEVSFGDR